MHSVPFEIQNAHKYSYGNLQSDVCMHTYKTLTVSRDLQAANSAEIWLDTCSGVSPWVSKSISSRFWPFSLLSVVLKLDLSLIYISVSSFLSLFLLIEHHSVSHCCVCVCACVCVRACVQPPLGKAFFSFQYDIDFLYDFIRLIPALPPCTLGFSLSPPLSSSHTHTNTHTHTDAHASVSSQQSVKAACLWINGLYKQISTVEMENGLFRKAEHIT